MLRSANAMVLFYPVNGDDTTAPPRNLADSPVLLVCLRLLSSCQKMGGFSNHGSLLWKSLCVSIIDILKRRELALMGLPFFGKLAA